jgi:hypothetical protein
MMKAIKTVGVLFVNSALFFTIMLISTIAVAGGHASSQSMQSGYEKSHFQQGETYQQDGYVTPIDFDAGPPGESCLPQDISVIDIMVLYSPRRKADMGENPLLYVNRIIHRANEVYEQSGVNIILRPVHIAQIDVENEEAGLLSLKTRPEVVQWREEYRADLVHWLYHKLSDTGHCSGSAQIPNDLLRTGLVSSKFAFSMSNQFCSTDPPLTFLHEIGHNLGLTHSRDPVGRFSNRSLDYGHGYGVMYKFGTIMTAGQYSYGAPRVPYFSNPNIICFENLPCGVPKDEPKKADAAAAMNMVAPYVAGFRESCDGISRGVPLPEGYPPEQNLILNPDFTWEYDDNWYTVIYDWMPYGGTYIEPWKVRDLDRETNEIEIVNRFTEEAGVMQSLDATLFESNDRLRLSMLILLASPEAEDVARISLILTNDASEEFVYSIEGPVVGNRYTQVQGEITVNFTGTLTSAQILINGPAPDVRFNIVKPEMHKIE